MNVDRIGTSALVAVFVDAGSEAAGSTLAPIFTVLNSLNVVWKRNFLKSISEVNSSVVLLTGAILELKSYVVLMKFILIDGVTLDMRTLVGADCPGIDEVLKELFLIYDTLTYALLAGAVNTGSWFTGQTLAPFITRVHFRNVIGERYHLCE